MNRGRVMADHGSGYLVKAGTGMLQAHWPGRDPENRPVTGDIVLLEAEGGVTLIREILPREYILVRREPGSKGQNQILAVNCGTALVFLSAGRRRLRVPALLERWLVLLTGAGITPVVMVNKIDTDPRFEDWLPELEAVIAASGKASVPLFPVSLLTGEGWDPLLAWLSASAPAIRRKGGLLLAGPSGAGKSTFLNKLAGETLSPVGMVRIQDGRGRHTTTERRLLELPGLFPVMDTPGLKELGLPDQGENLSLGEIFTEIAEYALNCRFRDCLHNGEPGCAVQEALARGEIDFRRFQTWRDMEEESRRSLKRGKSGRKSPGTG